MGEREGERILRDRLTVRPCVYQVRTRDHFVHGKKIFIRGEREKLREVPFVCVLFSHTREDSGEARGCDEEKGEIAAREFYTYTIRYE